MNNKEATKQVAEVVAGWRKAGIAGGALRLLALTQARQYRSQARRARFADEYFCLGVAEAFEKVAKEEASNE